MSVRWGSPVGPRGRRRVRHEIAEPDKEGGALRYRGVDIEDLVGKVPYEKVWGLLVDGSFDPGPAARRAASAGGALRRPPRRRAGARWPCSRPSGASRRSSTSPTSRRATDLARASVMALSFVAQSARGTGASHRFPSSRSTRRRSIPERFLIRWRGEADPDHVKAIDAYWISAAEHGMNASTFTARVVASTGADCAAALSSAVGALSGPLHGGAPSRVLKMLDEVEELRRRRQVGQGRAWTRASG